MADTLSDWYSKALGPRISGGTVIIARTRWSEQDLTDWLKLERGPEWVETFGEHIVTEAGQNG